MSYQSPYTLSEKAVTLIADIVAAWTKGVASNVPINVPINEAVRNLVRQQTGGYYIKGEIGQ